MSVERAIEIAGAVWPALVLRQEELLREYEQHTDHAVERKLQLAEHCFSSFRKLGFAKRASMMTKAAEILEKEKQTFGRLMTAEMGKTLASAIQEAEKCAFGCRYYAENAERFLAEEQAQTNAKRSFVRYQPLGPVLAVMPWNFPFWQVFRFAAPALMAGNVGLLKHASKSRNARLPLRKFSAMLVFQKELFKPSLLTQSAYPDLLQTRALLQSR